MRVSREFRVRRRRRRATTLAAGASGGGVRANRPRRYRRRSHRPGWGRKSAQIQVCNQITNSTQDVQWMRKEPRVTERTHKLQCILFATTFPSSTTRMRIRPFVTLCWCVVDKLLALSPPPQTELGELTDAHFQTVRLWVLVTPVWVRY